MAETPARRAPARREDAELDAFMRADIVEGRRARTISPHRVLLTGTVLFALGWLATDWTDEVRYHFSRAALVEAGSVDDLGAFVAPPVGSYARIQGVLGNKAATIHGLRPGSLRRGPVQIRQLLGSSIFVEFDEEELYARYQPFTRVHVEGRVVDFGTTSELARVRDYFRDSLRMDIPRDARLLVVGERPSEMWRYVVALFISALLGLASVTALARSARLRVVEDEQRS